MSLPKAECNASALWDFLKNEMDALSTERRDVLARYRALLDQTAGRERSKDEESEIRTCDVRLYELDGAFAAYLKIEESSQLGLFAGGPR